MVPYNFQMFRTPFHCSFFYICSRQQCEPWRRSPRIAASCQGLQICSFVAPGQPSGKLGVSYACRWSRLMASIILLTRPLWGWKPQVWRVTKSDDADMWRSFMRGASQQHFLCLCIVSGGKRKKILNIRPSKSVKLAPQSHCNVIQVSNLWLPVESSVHSEVGLNQLLQGRL